MSKKHYAFTQQQIADWIAKGMLKIDKFKGVTMELDGKTVENRDEIKLFHKDSNGKKREIIPQEKQKQLIIQLYQDPAFGLNSLQKFYAKLQDKYLGIPRALVHDVLESIPTYQQFKPAIKQDSTTRPIVSKRPYSRIQIDLIDFSKLSTHNNGYKWILTIIDTFSKKAWAYKLKNKTADQVWQQLEHFLDQIPNDQKISIIQSDNGTEFQGIVSEELEKRGIKQIFSSPYHPQSQGAVESFNGQLKRLLARVFAQNKSKNWIDYLDDVLKNYNESLHGTTNHKPDEVANQDVSAHVVADVKDNIEQKAKQKISYATSFKDDLHIGDWVRVSLYSSKDTIKNKLSKRNLNPKYSKEVYEINKVIRPREGKSTVTTPIKYKLKGEKGYFYRFRLLKTVAPEKQINQGVEEDEELERPEEIPEEKHEEKEKPKEPEAKRSTRKKKNLNYRDVSERGL
jgi:hypothetical protein